MIQSNFFAAAETSVPAIRSEFDIFRSGTQHFYREINHPGYPISGKSPVGSFYRGGTFKPLGEPPLDNDSPQLKWPAMHLSGISRDAMETTFNASRPQRNCAAAMPSSRNPELIHAPARCIDYVIVHEVCHLRHPNHDRAFYRLLSTLMPDWQAMKQKLEQTEIS